MLLFYDFEVFIYDWMVTIIDMEHQKVFYFENDPDGLKDFYETHKESIWVGCNNHHYDDWVLKGILLDFDPYDVNGWIITKDQPGYMYSNLFRKIPLLSYDVMTRIDRGLKFWEGSLGNRIKETSVDFRIGRKLTRAELDEVRKYNLHDVEQTIEVFIQKKADFDAIMGLIKMFPDTLSIRDIGLTKAQISAKILGCERVRRDDEFDFQFLPCIQIHRYTEVLDFYRSFMKSSPLFSTDRDKIYKQSLTITIAGVEHKISWGGIHGGRERYRRTGGLQMWHIDVQSFYPRLMIFWDLLTRNASRPERFREIYERRISLKKAGKKKEQAPLKIVINGTFGISKSSTSTAYDPRQANNICVNGQLLLVDLIEHLEVIPGFELIQSNTDGLIVGLPDTDEAFNQMDDVCYEWETRCRMLLEFDQVTMIAQKDVNNYVFKFESGKLERKGAYVKELSPLDYDLPIVNKALVDNLVKGIPVETTIMGCDLLKEFQMVKKISSKYSHLLYGGYWVSERRVNPKTGKLKTFTFLQGEQKQIPERCVRVFASTNSADGGLWQVKLDGAVEKVSDTPEHCFMVNDDVNTARVPQKLDKRWYIDLAKKRLKGFGP